MSGGRSTRTQPEESANQEFIFSREYRAPKELVAAAWTDPERMHLPLDEHGQPLFGDHLARSRPPGIAGSAHS